MKIFFFSVHLRESLDFQILLEYSCRASLSGEERSVVEVHSRGTRTSRGAQRNAEVRPGLGATPMSTKQRRHCCRTVSSPPLASTGRCYIDIRCSATCRCTGSCWTRKWRCRSDENGRGVTMSEEAEGSGQARLVWRDETLDER